MSEPALKERLSQGFWLHRQSLPEDHLGGPITLACHNQTCTQVIFADDKIEWNRFIVIPETIFSLSHFLIHFLVWVAVKMAHPELCLTLNTSTMVHIMEVTVAVTGHACCSKNKNHWTGTGLL